MKRISLAFMVLFVVVGIISTQSPAARAAAIINNFTIEDYQIDYYLNRPGDGRSALKTDESITALFPVSNQNHGIERAIPAKYDGHSTNLKIESKIMIKVKTFGRLRLPLLPKMEA